MRVKLSAAIVMKLNGWRPSARSFFIDTCDKNYANFTSHIALFLAYLALFWSLNN